MSRIATVEPFSPALQSPPASRTSLAVRAPVAGGPVAGPSRRSHHTAPRRRYPSAAAVAHRVAAPARPSDAQADHGQSSTAPANATAPPFTIPRPAYGSSSVTPASASAWLPVRAADPVSV